MQANSIAEALDGAFGIPKLISGLVIATLAGIIIFGGLRKIATVAEFVVPFMAGAYLLMAAYVLVTHLTLVPGVIASIFLNAFGLHEAAGGVAVASPRQC